MDLMKERKNFHSSPCCYVIYFDSQPIYIGSTNNLRARFLGHSFRYGYAKVVMTPWGDFDSRMKITIKYRPSKKYGDWLMIEARLIMRLQPIFNKLLKKKQKKETV